MALFFIQLIVMFPIYSSFAYADLSFNYLGGKAGTNGYRAVNDYTKIEAVSTTPYVQISSSPSLTLDCVPIVDSGYYNCSYTTDEFEISSSGGSPTPLSIEETDAQGNSLPGSSAQTSFITVDYGAPTIDITGISQQGNTDVQLTFNAQDSDSGLLSAEFYINNEAVAKYDFESGAKDYSGSVTFNTSKSGNVSIHALVTDRVYNYFYSEPKNYMLDFANPSIDPTFKIYQNEKQVFYVSRIGAFSNYGGLQNIEVRFVVQDANLDSSSVMGDLEEININPAANIYYREPIQASCSKIGDITWDCAFNKDSIGEPLKFYPNNEIISINTTAKDTFGNSAEKIMTSAIIIDETSPNTTFLGTNHCSENQCYVNLDNNQILTSIINTGAAFENKWVYFDLSSISNDAQAYEFQASNCTGTTSVTCDITANLSIKTDLSNGENYGISISPKSIDDVGNTVEILDINLVYDGEYPQMTDIDFKSDLGTDYVVSGDSLIVTATINDAYSGVKNAYADFSAAIDGANSLEAICEKQGTDNATTGETICTWTTTNVNEGPLTADIIFSIEDYAGNIINITEGLEIYGISNESANLWSVDSKTYRPAYYDASVMQYVPSGLTEWIDVALKSKYSDVTILNMQLESQTCTPTTNSSMVGDTKLFRGARTKENRITNSGVITLSTNLAGLGDNTGNITTISYTCILKISSAYNQLIYPTENLDVVINVPVDNSGFDLPTDWSNRLDDLESELRDSRWIDTVSEYVSYADTICSLGEGLTNALQAVAGILEAIAAALQGTGWGDALAITLHTTSNSIATGITLPGQFIFSWVCAFVHCNYWELINSSSNDAFKGFIKTMTDWMNKYYALTGFSTTGKKVVREGVYATGPDLMGTEVRYSEVTVGTDILPLAKKSIILSAFTLCIPGILYNLEKARSIDCKYLVCMRDFVSAGENPYRCEVARAYEYCKFVWGSIFYALPLSSFLDSISNLIKLFTDDIYTATGAAFSLSCVFIPGYKLSLECRLLSWFNAIQGLINQINGLDTAFTEDNWSYWCNQALD